MFTILRLENQSLSKYLKINNIGLCMRLLPLLILEMAWKLANLLQKNSIIDNKPSANDNETIKLSGFCVLTGFFTFSLQKEGSNKEDQDSKVIPHFVFRQWYFRIFFPNYFIRPGHSTLSITVNN